MAVMPQKMNKTDNPMKNWILKRFEHFPKEVWYIKYLIILSFNSNLSKISLQSILPFCQKGFNLKQEVTLSEMLQTITIL
tara:strand:- start:142 stop:381 length:240 start_codon:yes stop_codon:yes gene_type:complete